MKTSNQYSHKKKLRWLMAYIGMPLIFAAAGFPVLGLGGRPVMKSYEMTLNTLFNSGEAYYAISSGMVLNENGSGADTTIHADSETGNKETVEEPNIGDRYGQLVCERLGINAPVYFGDNDDVLNMGIGTYPASWIPGCGHTTLMSGHNNTSLKVLGDVEIGDEFLLTTEYGEYKYVVSEFTIVHESEVEACRLDSDEEQVVIYTCYPFYRISGRRTERFFVYLKKVSGPEIELIHYYLKD